jgi:hypothetical protein
MSTPTAAGSAELARSECRPFGWYCLVAGALALILVNR